MARLEPCPACRRHVFANDRACPFCGDARATTPAWSIALLGMSLVACTAHREPKPEPTPAKAPEPERSSPDEAATGEPATTPKPRSPEPAQKPIYGGPRPREPQRPG